MDLHKPKPIHGWRDFLKEVGTIVLGVSIALAAEQGVEWAHWRNQVAEAREVIAAEMATNLYGAISRVRTMDCAERRLDALGSILDAAAKTGNLPPVGEIGMPWRQVYPSGAWESVMASQAATHFPSQQLADLSTAYKVVERLENATNLEMEFWNSLYAIVGPGRRLDPASEAKLRDALSQARTRTRLIASLSVQLMQTVKRLHLRFSRGSLDHIALAERVPLTLKTDVCVPIGAVPANYGQGYVSRLAGEIAATAKHLPDFGGE
jgi:hypothetical protein